MANKHHQKRPIWRSSLMLWPLAALVAGGIIYILFRPGEPVFFNWIRTAGLESWLIAVRELPAAGRMLPPWLVYSLPNGLWAFAYAFLMISLWRKSRSLVKYLWLLTIPLLVFGFEILQLTGIVRGTFCWNDLLFGALGIIAGVTASGVASGSHFRSLTLKRTSRFNHRSSPYRDITLNQP